MIAVWFSCGAASAVAAKLALEWFSSTHDVRIVYYPVKNEHPDNQRFLADCERWLGVKVEIAFNSKYPSCDIMDTFERKNGKGYVGGVRGAPCTVELKKRARQQWEEEHKPDFHVLGFDVDETDRYRRFSMTERPNTIPVLILAGLSKQDCIAKIDAAGIKRPVMYDLGFPNNNCIGCVKASGTTYWNRIRECFPEIYDDRAKYTRRIGAKLIRINGVRRFLDELRPEHKGRAMRSMKLDCGIFCEERAAKTNVDDAAYISELKEQWKSFLAGSIK
jgi:3'-phosphoadenosine 5'-phosphosulfate sulfotransferase (PAPS reductase)/FAD synthetase